MIKKTLFALCLTLAGAAQAQDIEGILRLVEQNNPELQAARREAEAARLETRSQNAPEDPTVEYSPFFAKGTPGMASSELVVSQGFDFPTLYAARRRAGQTRAEAAGLRAEATRRDILLAAKVLCLDLVRLNRQSALLAERRQGADELLALCEERLRKGNATALDVNKVKMERMAVQAEQARNDAAHRTALQQLLAMNGNLPLEFSATEYPAVPAPNYAAMYDALISADAALQAADADARAAGQETSVARQGWLPKLSVGYRRNTAVGERSNGFLIGGSLPLFSNRHKVKAARATADAARLRADAARQQAEASAHARMDELRRLSEALAAYDVPLMRSTLTLLKESVVAGRLSLIDYYGEADNVYRNLEAHAELESQYQKLLAELGKNRL